MSTLPQKRVLGESRTRQNLPPSPSSAKKRKTDIFSSSPARPRLPPSSQNGPGSKMASSQPKSAFESEVLEKLTQDMTDLKKNSAEKDQAWDRPPLENFNPEKDDLCFQSIEIEEGTLSGGRPTVKLFGVNDKGNSVMLHVTDFKHYLFVAAPVSFQPSDLMPYKVFLESQIAQHQPAIHSTNLCMRENILGFQGNKKVPFIKITATDPKFISKIRATIESGDGNWKGMWKGAEGGIKTFDNIQYVMRFMVDCKVRKRKGLATFPVSFLLTYCSFKACPG